MSSVVAFLVLASEAAGEESSKTAFYVAGGLLAAWAVVLSAVGLTSPSFPSTGAARGVIALTVVLVAAAMATAILTA